MHKIVKIRGKIQPYQWGGFEFLPRLLGLDNSVRQPAAEYWLGGHPSAPALAEIDNKTVLINDFLSNQQSPPLNFLLKILDVCDMLSIQAHPNDLQAARGYDRENQMGIALSAPQRNYKDKSAKPELMLALSEFWLLHGLQDRDQILANLHTHPELLQLRKLIENNDIATGFASLLDINNPYVQDIQNQLAARLKNTAPIHNKFNIEYWIQSWLQKNPQILQGILTLYFMNLVKLNQGEGIYQPAGLLHAYLEGQNIELMANSDNVLRAGLTPKHIDTEELLKIAQFEHTDPQAFRIQTQIHINGEIHYITPFTQFELSELNNRIQNQITWQSQSPEILFCYQGNALITATGNKQVIKQGEAVLILANQQVQLEFSEDDTHIYKARNL
jgi:mannose-6-phosphate isomerase